MGDAIPTVERTLVADIVPAERRGTAYGVYHTAVGLAAFPASFIAGVLWRVLSPAAPFAFGAALALMATLLLRFWFPRLRRSV